MDAIARVLTVDDGRARLACDGRSSCSACIAGHGGGVVAMGRALRAACGWALARVAAQRGQPCVSVQRLSQDAEA